MKTGRLTLLISPAEKAAINARAALLGISVRELIGKFALDDEAVTEVEVQLPEYRPSISSIHASFEHVITRLDESQRRDDEMETSEYRAYVDGLIGFVQSQPRLPN